MISFFFFYFYGCRVCVIAGNISPIDVITHVPILCEESDIPYVYVPSKEVSSMNFFFFLISSFSLFLLTLKGEIRDCCFIGTMFYGYTKKLIKIAKIFFDLVLTLCRYLSLIMVFVQDLANAGATKRPTCCVLVLTKPAKGELSPEEQEKLKSDYDQVAAEVSQLASSLF